MKNKVKACCFISVSDLKLLRTGASVTVYGETIPVGLEVVPLYERGTFDAQVGNYSQPNTRPLPSQTYLQAILRYDSDTGKLFWKTRISVPSGHVNQWNSVHAGKEAFTYSDRRGYKKGKIDGIGYQAHRIIWKLVHGQEPDCIDHINSDPSDNRLENLRSCSNAENSRNYFANPKTSAFHGVHWSERSKKWIAEIFHDRAGRVSLGKFDYEEMAAAEYDCAAQQYCGANAILNFPTHSPLREGEDSAEVYRHKKRGSIYTVMAHGRLQVDGDLDNEKVVIYRGEDGQTWVRPEYEFNDGRFEALAATRSGSATSSKGASE